MSDLELCSECEQKIRHGAADIEVISRKGALYSLDVKMNLSDAQAANTLALMFENENLFDMYIDGIFAQLRARLKFIMRANLPELQALHNEICQKCKTCPDRIEGEL